MSNKVGSASMKKQEPARTEEEDSDTGATRTALVREELGRFCLTTSMRGVPRAARSEWPGLRVAWIVAVVMLLTLLAVNLFYVLTAFFAYPVTLNIAIRHYEPGSDSELVPEVVLCNEDPLASLTDAERTTRFGSVSEYEQRVSAIADRFPADDREYIRLLLQEPKAIYQNLLAIPHSAATDNSSLVTSCHVAVLMGQGVATWPCEDMVRMSTFMDPDYFRCTSLKVAQGWYEGRGEMVGISLVLYVASAAHWHVPHAPALQALVSSSRRLHGGGAIVLPKHEHQPSLPALQGVRVAAGTMATVHVAMEKHVLLPEPYGNCQKNARKDYNELTCYNRCQQNKVQDACGCTDARLGAEFPSSDQYPYCLRLDPVQVRDWLAANNSDASTPLDAYACASDVLLEQERACVDACPLRCEAYAFTPRPSAVTWPPVTAMAEFYDRFIAGREYEARFDLVRQAVDGACTGEVECQLLLLRAHALIQSNFLHVTVQMGDHSFKEFEDTPALTVSELMAQLGGLLNLWAGITVVVMLELIETLVRMCVRCARKHEKQ